MRCAAACVVVLVALLPGSYGLSVTHLGGFSAPDAAFLSLFPVGAHTTLVISQFTGDPFAADSVGFVYDIGKYVKTGTVSGANVSEVTQAIVWPNDLEAAPSPSGVGSFHGIIAPGGFLVPPKSVGAVHLMSIDPDTGVPSGLAQVSVDKGNALFDGWFYHRAVLLDVDGDGLVDVLSARASKPLLGPAGGELVWMKQPNAVDPLSPSLLPWQEFTLYNGTFSPDVFFTVVALRSDGDEQVFYASFFTGGGLGMLLCPGCGDGTNTWSNTKSLVQVVLDDSIGPSFDVQAVDLNGDGRVDLLVTNHVDNATSSFQSGVFAYEAPPAGVSLTNASAWVKHTLVLGFVVREGGPNQAAPGAARPLTLTTTGGKPIITVAGDGDQRMYVLTPESQSPSVWKYKQSLLWDCGGTVGRQVSGDVDGDASTQELFVSCYDSGTVQVFQFS